MAIQLHMRTTFCDPFVDVYISDTGSGILDEIKSKIFDPFFTTRALPHLQTSDQRALYEKIF
jgi:C4-dicarboxylate-specific signal transduction histidine kinase